MKRLKFLLLLAFVPFCFFAQREAATAQQKKSYPAVISEYIKAISKISNLRYDTLFIGEHDEFPKINLPAIIQGKKIILLDSRKPTTGVEKRESFVLVNLVELKMTKEESKFMLITFFKGYKPQHNMYLTLMLNPVSNEYELAAQPELEYAYGK